MTMIIAIHSNRGGVGKTLFTINLAMVYAILGRNVCLIDLDFRAPAISDILQLQCPNLWMNDFLDGHGKIGDALIDVTSKFKTDGKLLVGLADPSLDSVRNMAWKDKRWEMKALQRLTSIKRELAEKGVDYVIFDTSPGILYSSVNAVVSSDVVVILTAANDLDVKETQRVITELYQPFEKPTYILINKVMPMFQWRDTERNVILKKFTSIFSAPIIAVIPCYCDLLNSSRMTIYTREMPEHPFSKAIYDIANKLSSTKIGEMQE